MVNIENLMLKREHFPLDLKNHDRTSTFSNALIIPPFHKSIVESGIDLDLAFSIIDEAVENTLLDYEETKTRTHLLSQIKLRDDKISLGSFKKNLEYIYFSEFPFTFGLCIKQNGISPNGNDFYIRIQNPMKNTINYTIPENVPMTLELLKEYFMAQGKSWSGHRNINCKTGWTSHNVDDGDVFYKNFIIALNNAVVREKYSE